MTKHVARALHDRAGPIICKALVCIFKGQFFSFTTGSRWYGLHKLHLLPQSRYSEDIDLVQINQPIKPILSVWVRCSTGCPIVDYTEAIQQYDAVPNGE